MCDLFSRPSIVIGFACAPGKVALEPDSGRNGFFTAALLMHIQECGHYVDVAFLLRLVRSSVLASSGGRQDPWFCAALPNSSVLVVEGEAESPVAIRPFPDCVSLSEVFVGREGALARLLDDHACATTVVGVAATPASEPSSSGSGEGRLSLISGLGGVGKSALARELCRRARTRVLYPTGVFWVDADSSATLDRSFRDIAIRPPLSMDCYRDTASKPEDVRGAVLDWLSTHDGWLLVMDNADNLSVVQPYVPRGRVAVGGHVVVTSRASSEAFAKDGLLPAGATVEEMGILSCQDAITMLVSVQHNRTLSSAVALETLGGEASSEAAAARWLAGVDGVHGLALALQQAGAYVRERKGTWAAYVTDFERQRVKLFGDAPLVRTPWDEVETWLDVRQLTGCGPALRAFGVERLSDLGDVTESDLTSLDLSPLRRRQLWRAMQEAGGSFIADDPRLVNEVRQFLVKGLGFGQPSVDAVVGQCSVRRLNDLRGVAAIHQRVEQCALIHVADKERLLHAMSFVGGIPTEDDDTRRTVRTTWSLSMGLLKSVPDVGPAAVEALQLCSFVAPDNIPVELVARAGYSLPDASLLRRFILGQGAAGAATDEGCGDEGPSLDSMRRSEDVVALLARHSLVSGGPGATRDAATPPCFSMHRLLQGCVAQDVSTSATTVSSVLAAACGCGDAHGELALACGHRRAVEHPRVMDRASRPGPVFDTGHRGGAFWGATASIL